MHTKWCHSLTFAAVSLLLALTSCTQDSKTPLSSRQELVRLQREYLLLQKERQDLQTQVTAFKQVHETYKLSLASRLDHNKALEEQLLATQKNLISQQHEYQSLLADYVSLEASIAPLAARLKASVATLRKKLIGTELGTVVLKNERQLHQAVVTEITDDALRIKSKSGWTWVEYVDLPPTIQKRFFHAPLLVSPEALIFETPAVKEPTLVPDKNEQARALIEAAFAKRHQLELAQFRVFMQDKIPALEKKIVLAKQQIKNLSSEKKNVSRQYSRSSGSIKRSTVDRDKAMSRIDADIRKLETAIQTAKLQISSWKKELIRNESDNK